MSRAIDPLLLYNRQRLQRECRIEGLSQIFDGWNGYQTSLLRAIEPLTPEQLAWRVAEGRRSIGELTH
ncbi:MAG TPA: hypothetical protein VFW23_10245, partial [Tepidisphaeraceae bacterium]|nr:hypothetical protein [Tepidisphaeraceae bacterium]